MIKRTRKCDRLLKRLEGAGWRLLDTVYYDPFIASGECVYHLARGHRRLIVSDEGGIHFTDGTRVFKENTQMRREIFSNVKHQTETDGSDIT